VIIAGANQKDAITDLLIVPSAVDTIVANAMPDILTFLRM
jgi:hypothetical protein